MFSFTVVTPKMMYSNPNPELLWGRGFLIVPFFSCSDIEEKLMTLIGSISGTSWMEIAEKLNQKNLDHFTVTNVRAIALLD